MATFAVDLYVEPPQTAVDYSISPRPLDAWQLATIEWGTGQLTGFVNKGAAVAGVPAGMSINASRIAPDGMKRPKREGGIGSGVVPMQTAKVKFQDKTSSLSRLIAEKRANGFGMRGKVMKLYEWEAGETVDLERDLVGTYRLDDRFWRDGYRTLTGLDIRRQLKNKIFEPEAYKLVSSLTDESTTLEIKLPYEFNAAALPLFVHNERYSSDPGEYVWYVRTSSGEIIKCPGLSCTAVAGQPNHVLVTGAVRGALNTADLVEAVPVQADAEEDNLPDLDEWIYLEETMPDMIKIITTGTSFNGRPAPAHWTISMDEQWLDTDSLLYSAPELASLPLRAENYGSVSVKDLIENEILPFLPATMQVSASGKIQLRRITTIKSVGPEAYRFDSSVIDRGSVGEIKTIVSHIRAGVAIRAGWDARSEVFGSPVYFEDSGANAANDDTADAEVLILESKLMHSSIHTNAQIRRLLPAMAEHYLGEKIVFPARVKPTAAIVDVGQRVHVTIEGVPDDASLEAIAPDIDRSLLVTSLSAEANGTMYQFTGTSGLAVQYFDALTAPSLLPEEYTRGAIQLQDAIPASALELVDGIYYLQSGTYELSFREKYVFDLGPLYHTAGSTIVCAPGEEGPMFQLWIPHAWHSDSPTTVVTVGKGGKIGGIAGGVAGSGFAVPTTGTGTLSAIPFTGTSDGSGDTQITAWSLSARAGAQSQSYSTGDVPSISLSYNDDTLIGLPVDLSGYPGVGGGSTTVRGWSRNGDTTIETFDGGRGGTNSAGVMIVHQGATMAPAARFIVNGAPGDAPVRITRPGNAQDLVNRIHYTQAGSGSGPGTVLLCSDGPFTSFDVSAHVDAYPGETFYEGDQMEEPRLARVRGGANHSHFRAMSHEVNLAPICARFIYMPAAANIQERQFESSVNEFFENQRDQKVKIFTAVKPSDANFGDAYISKENLEGNDIQPYFEVFTAEGVWVGFDWVNDDFKPLYSALINMLRVYGGTTWTFGETFPTEFTPGDSFTDELSGNTYILSSDGNHRLILRGDTAVGDERNSDFALFNTLQTYEDDGFLYYVGLTSADAMPLQTSAKVATSSARPTIVSITYSGAFSAVTDDPTLQPPTGASFTAYDENSGELVWTRSADETGVSGYRVHRDGIEIGTTSGNSLYMSMLDAGTTYAFSVVAYGSSGESAAATATGTTGAGLFAVVSDGATVQVTGTAAMESRGLYMEFRDSAGGTIHAETVNFTSGSVSYLPPSPASYATWTGYVIDTNGDGFSLPGQPRTYQQ